MPNKRKPFTDSLRLNHGSTDLVVRSDSNPEQPPVAPRQFYQRAYYRFVKLIVSIGSMVFYKTRVHRLENVLHEGPSLVLVNHQSNLDAMVMGAIYPGILSSMAKHTLFKYPPLSWILHGLDSIPVDRTSTGLGGMKTVLKRLKAGYRVMLFPEGQRSFDGELQPLMTGFCLLVRKSRVPMVPVCMDGPFQAWPRGTKFPKPGRIHVVVGEPIHFHEVEHMSDDEMAEFVFVRMKKCFDEARDLRIQAISNLQSQIS